MANFSREIQIRWSDFDPNFHVRHTSYYEWGTLVRLEFFESLGVPLEKMVSERFGPVLLREECVFRREVQRGDHIFVELELLKAKNDFSRWTIQHPIKKEDGTLAALITIEGGFIDHTTRKLMVPPSSVIEVFNQMPKNSNFSWIE